MQLKHKSFEVADFKMLEDGPGGFTAYVSAFGNVDSAGEVVEKGAFTETLADFVTDGWIAVNHKWGETGKATITAAKEDGNGLFIEAMFHSTEDAQAERVKMRERIERGKSVKFSIGYRVEEDEVKDGVRYLKKLKLYEASIVNVPANTQANAVGVKGALLGNIESRMALSGLSTGYDAMWYRMYEILYQPGITGEEAAALVGPMFDEFRDVLLRLILALLPGSESGDATGGALIAAKLAEITGVQYKSDAPVETKSEEAETEGADAATEEAATETEISDGTATVEDGAVEEKAGRRLSTLTKNRLNKNISVLKDGIAAATEAITDIENFIKEDEEVFEFIKSDADGETKAEADAETKTDAGEPEQPGIDIAKALIATNLKITNTITTTTEH